MGKCINDREHKKHRAGGYCLICGRSKESMARQERREKGRRKKLRMRWENEN